MARTDIYNYEVSSPYYQRNNLNNNSAMDPSGLGVPYSPTFGSYIVNTKSASDTFSSSTSNTSSNTQLSEKDDGDISFTEKLKSFGKGLISPITSMFSSPGNFLKGAAMIVAGAALCIATGGAAAPFLVAAGVAMGGYQVAKGAYCAATAETDEEAKQAWEEMGAGTSTLALSAAGAKASIASAESAGVEVAANVKDMNAIQATVECIKAVPSSVTRSAEIFKSGEAITNLSAFATKIGLKKENTSTSEPEVSTNELPDEKNNIQPSTEELRLQKEAKLKEQHDADVLKLEQEKELQGSQQSNTKVVKNEEISADARLNQYFEANKVGKTTITNRSNGKLVDAIVTKQTNSYGHETYKIFVDGQEVGSAKIKLLETVADFESEGIIKSSPKAVYGTGKDLPKFQSKVYVDLMEAHGNGAYHGIGTKLHQIAIERSNELGFGGRVELDAAWNSHGFHYNTGFRPMGKSFIGNAQETALEIESILAAAKENNHMPDTKGLGGIEMYLPEDQIAAWNQRIAENPILQTKSQASNITVNNLNVQRTKPILEQLKQNAQNLKDNKDLHEMRNNIKDLHQNIDTAENISHIDDFLRDQDEISFDPFNHESSIIDDFNPLNYLDDIHIDHLDHYDGY